MTPKIGTYVDGSGKQWRITKVAGEAITLIDSENEVWNVEEDFLDILELKPLAGAVGAVPKAVVKEKKPPVSPRLSLEERIEAALKTPKAATSSKPTKIVTTKKPTDRGGIITHAKPVKKLVPLSLAPGAKQAQKFRDLADRMQGQIDAKLHPAISEQRTTARRAHIGAGMREDGLRMEKTQATLRAMADAIDAGTLPESLWGIKDKAILETLKRYKEFHWGVANDPKHWMYKDMQRLMKAGINRKAFDKAKSDLNALAGTHKPSISPEEKRLAEMERGLIGTKIPGYFPTPSGIASNMVMRAHIRPGMSVLEPSAGKGDIAQEIRSTVPSAKLSTIEWNSTLFDILKAKGFGVVGDDFLKHTQKYDRIIMNPPFENLQDIDHVQHAYSLLKPGVKLVSVMSESPFFRSDKKAVEFREWLQSVGGTSEKQESGAFYSSDRPTGAATRIVEIEKAGVEKAKKPKAPKKTPLESAIAEATGALAVIGDEFYHPGLEYKRDRRVNLAIARIARRHGVSNDALREQVLFLPGKPAGAITMPERPMSAEELEVRSGEQVRPSIGKAIATFKEDQKDPFGAWQSVTIPVLSLSDPINITGKSSSGNWVVRYETPSVLGGTGKQTNSEYFWKKVDAQKWIDDLKNGKSIKPKTSAVAKKQERGIEKSVKPSWILVRRDMVGPMGVIVEFGLAVDDNVFLSARTATNPFGTSKISKGWRPVTRDERLGILSRIDKPKTKWGQRASVIRYLEMDAASIISEGKKNLQAEEEVKKEYEKTKKRIEDALKEGYGINAKDVKVGSVLEWAADRGRYVVTEIDKKGDIYIRPESEPGQSGGFLGGKKALTEYKIIESAKTEKQRMYRAEKTKTEAWLQDVKLQQSYDFKFKDGERVSSPDYKTGIPKNYIVLSHYIEEGKPRYVVYPPGKKGSTAHHVWISENELTSREKPFKPLTKAVAPEVAEEVVVGADIPSNPIRYDPSINRYNGKKLVRGDILVDQEGNRYRLERQNGFMLSVDKVDDSGKVIKMLSVSVDPMDTDRYLELYEKSVVDEVAKKQPWEITREEYVKKRPLPTSGLFDPKKPIKSEGRNISAVKLDDGTIYVDTTAVIHVDVIENLGIPPERVVEGGFIIGNKYVQGGADAARIGRQNLAKRKVEHSRSVYMAMEQGKPVPPKVLADYPELQGRAAVKAISKIPSYERTAAGEQAIFVGMEGRVVPKRRKSKGVDKGTTGLDIFRGKLKEEQPELGLKPISKITKKKSHLGKKRKSTHRPATTWRQWVRDQGGISKEAMLRYEPKAREFMSFDRRRRDTCVLPDGHALDDLATVAIRHKLLRDDSGSANVLGNALLYDKKLPISNVAEVGIREQEEVRVAPEVLTRPIPNQETINETELDVGDKFTRDGDKYKVVIDPNTGEKMLLDGIALSVDDFENVEIDAGSLKKPKVGHLKSKRST